MLYRCPYEDRHVYVCNKVGWLAHPLPGHGKKSGYATVGINDTRLQAEALKVLFHSKCVKGTITYRDNALVVTSEDKH